MRLFVAVWPPPAVAAAVRGAVEGVDSDQREGVRWTPWDQWHVTLRFFGEADAGAAAAAFRSVAGDRLRAPVVAAVGPATASFGRRVLHVPVAGLDAVAAAVIAATAEVGRPPDQRPFTGHLTLARAPARAGVDLTAWCGIPVSGSWSVAELTLVASRTAGPGGSRYEVVDRLALA
ncbi:MAG TPA: RNA 2',3'-cyclic phosphodiesterase [Acidimicrobiales bacterium]|nr:RNA 2',3'-cyclic phosphodiesterase [Acidimicrobiales bacterium]